MNRCRPIALALAAALPAAACGPFFPSTFLEAPLNESPHPAYIDFGFALLEVADANHLLPQPAPVLPHGETNVVEADVRDFEARLALPDVAPTLGEKDRARRVARYRVAAQAAHDERIPRIHFPAETHPAAREFILYLDGCNEVLNQKNPTNLPVAWQRLLALPPEQRRFRTTWILYMQGTLAARAGRMDEAARSYAELREAAAAGFHDRCGLAHFSFGRAYRDGDRAGLLHKLRAAPAALAYYRHARDAESYQTILSDLFASTFHSVLTNTNLKPILADPIAREVLIARLADRRGNFPEIEESVLDALQPASSIGAARMAFIAFGRDDLPATRAWLDATAPNSLTRLWIEAELERRAGHPAQAALKYRQWLAGYEQLARAIRKDVDPRDFAAVGLHGYRPTPAFANELPVPFFADYSIACARTADQEVHGLLGTTLVSRRDFAEALDCFVRAGAWLDAACVAERHVALSDLKRYLTPAQIARETARPKDSDADRWCYPEEFIDLRHLLGRRMLREEPGPTAVPWFPKELQPFAARLAEALRIANDDRQPRNRRAVACINAGRLLRWHGMELVGTEMEPDSFYTRGDFFFGNPVDSSYGLDADVPAMFEFRPTEVDDKQSLGLLEQRTPWVRFHYRLQAAGLMRRAADLSDRPEIQSLALYLGGYFIRERHQLEADYFAKRLGRMDQRLAPARWLHDHGWFTTRMTPWMSDVADRDLKDLPEAAVIPANLFNEPST